MWKQQVRNDSYYLAGSLNTRYYVSELLSKMYSRQSITESMFLPSMISPAVHNYTEKNKTSHQMAPNMQYQMKATTLCMMVSKCCTGFVQLTSCSS